jgi:hypothetical protein
MAVIPSKVVASDGVAHRQGEEDEAEGQHDDVHHLHAPSARQSGAYLSAPDTRTLICINRAKTLASSIGNDLSLGGYFFEMGEPVPL